MFVTQLNKEKNTSGGGGQKCLKYYRVDGKIELNCTRVPVDYNLGYRFFFFTHFSVVENFSVSKTN